MRSILFLSIAVCLLISPIIVNAATHHQRNEVCKETTLYPLTFPPWKAEHTILCHPIGKALARQNHANVNFNAGVVAGQKPSEGTKCPIGPKIIERVGTQREL